MIMNLKFYEHFIFLKFFRLNYHFNFKQFMAHMYMI